LPDHPPAGETPGAHGEAGHVVGFQALLSFTRACFERVGVRGEDAQAVADVLIDANLHGVPSHGFQRVPIFMRRVRAGLSGGTESLSVIAESGALCRIDAAHALGPAASVKALDHALMLARRFGIGLVAVGRSTHFGAAGYYARRAASAGIVSVVTSNAFKRMAPYGSAEVFLGTNPLAIGIPLAGRDPFVLDMATSIAAQGRITRARQLGEEIPIGLALDSEGHPTSDPVAALAGSLLPLGGPKGSGLALALSLLAMLLGEADSDDEMASLYRSFDRPQNTGHVFIAIDDARLGARAEPVEAMIERLLALRPLEGADAVEYPGQAGARLARSRREHGVPIDPSELAEVLETCTAFGLEDLAAWASELVAR
jgi:LDH2 family malate/lactate/ureidoglycolate dehydrogenase